MVKLVSFPDLLWFCIININDPCHITELVYWDMPYGLGLGDWDVLLTDFELHTLFQQIGVVNRSASSSIVLHTHWRDAGRVAAQLELHGYVDVQQLAIYKPMQNRKGMGFINALDTLILGFKRPVNGKIFMNFPQPSPLSRHNVLFGHQVGQKLVDSQSNRVNATQKHPEISTRLGKILCSPGASALVLGAGSGSEVIGLSRAGLNVTAVERDAGQFRAICARLQAELSLVGPDHAAAIAAQEREVATIHGLASRFVKLNPEVEAHFSSETVVAGAPVENKCGPTDCPVCGEGAGEACDMQRCALRNCKSSLIHRACGFRADGCVCTLLLSKPLFCSTLCSLAHTCE
jgi:hypothetical protein